MARFRILAAAVLSATVVPSAALAGPIVLVVGDSSAFGETNRTQDPSNGDRGYVSLFANYLGVTKYGGQRPTVLNLAIDGETSSSFFSGTGRVSSDGLANNSNYGPYTPNYPTQNAEMLNQIAAAKARGDRIDNILVQIGANNLDAVAHSDGFLALPPAAQQDKIVQAIGALQADYGMLLTELRQQLPTAQLYTMGYHNPYAGDPTNPLAPLAAPAVLGVDAVAAGMAGAFGGKYVDFYHVILGRERELTLIGTNDPVNNVHMNSTGYSLAGLELIRVASATPEPGTFVLVAIGLAGAAGARRATRRAATTGAA